MHSFWLFPQGNSRILLHSLSGYVTVGRGWVLEDEEGGGWRGDRYQFQPAQENSGEWTFVGSFE